MSEDTICITIITTLSTLLGGILGFGGAIISGKWSYKGAIDAVTRQINSKHEEEQKEREENGRVADAILEHFVRHEITANYKHHDDGTFISRLKMDKPSKYGYSPKFLEFEEFNKIKYELIKYSTSSAKEVLDIYKMFSIFERHSDIQSFNQNDFEKVREIFFRYKDKYIQEEP